MRVSDDMIQSILKSNMFRSRAAVLAIQQKITSGRQVEAASDDPSAFDTIQRTKNSQACLNQKLSNAQGLSLDLITIDGVLQNVQDIIQRASEICVTGSDGTKPPEDRISMSKEVDMLINQLADLANYNPAGRYIFAGLRTDTAPYAITKNAEGQITALTYQGDTGIREVEINKYIPGSSSNRIEANVPGSDPTSLKGVFETTQTSVFQTLITMRDRLADGRHLVSEETSVADAGLDQLAINQEYATGTQVSVATGGTLPGGLAAGVTYYAIRVDATHVQLAASYADAMAGIPVDITSAGTGEQKLSTMHLAELRTSLEHIMNQRADVGARIQRVTAAEATLMNQKQIQNDTLSELESVDVAAATIELTKQQSAYEAALRIIAATMQTSLVDYI